MCEVSYVIVSKNGITAFHEDYCPYVKRIRRENRKLIPEHVAVEHGYCECKFCRNVKGIVYKYRKKGFTNISYDAVDNAFCVRTDVGFWKLIWRNVSQDWHLFHMNHGGRGHFDNTLPSKELARGSFHRQRDFLPTVHISKALRYIEDHDKNYRIAEEDLKKMPKSTAKQRNHYRYHKKRKRQESIRNVYKILDQINKKEN